MLSRVPEGKRAEKFLTKKKPCLDGLCSDMEYTATGPEFNFNESRMHIK